MTSKNISYELIQYFVITYLFSWIFWIPAALYTQGIIPGSLEVFGILGTLASFGPMVAAFSLTLKNEGKKGLKELIKPITYIRLGWWWIPVMVIIPAGAILAHILNVVLFNASFPITQMLLEPWLIPFFFILMLLIGGPLAEEFGWRGYVLPRLQEKRNALTSSIVLGIIWGFWHLPLFFSIGQAHHDYIPLWLFVLTDIIFSIFITWVMNNTKKSLIPAFFIHNWINVVFAIFPLMEPVSGGNYMPWLLSIIILAIIIVIVILIYGPKTFVKENK